MTQGTPSTCKHLQERMGAKGCRATISDSPAQSMGVPPTVVTFPSLGPPKWQPTEQARLHSALL